MRLTKDAAEFLAQLSPLRHQLHAYALRALNRRHNAADVLQEVVLIAWNEYGRFVSGTNFRAWVFRILVNVVFNHNKRGRRETLHLDGFADDTLEVSLDDELAWEAILRDPDRLDDFLDERIVYALGSLGSTERQCFLLCVLHGFSYKEIAGLLEIPLGTVMSHVHRARIRLRKHLAGLASERRIYVEGES